MQHLVELQLPLYVHHELLSQDPVRVVLIAIIQFRGQGIQGILYQLLDLSLQLLLRKAHVESIPQISNSRRTTVLKAWQLGT